MWGWYLRRPPISSVFAHHLAHEGLGELIGVDLCIKSIISQSVLRLRCKVSSMRAGNVVAREWRADGNWGRCSHWRWALMLGVILLS